MTTPALPKEKKKVVISEETKKEFESSLHTEGQVIVHCRHFSFSEDTYIRIWPSTFLIDSATGTRSQLVHAENITLYPQWMPIPGGKETVFTLIFSGLSKSCRVFDLKEIIPESGGFEISNIKRNETDVYWVEV